MKWNNLTMAEKAKLMLLGVSKGITDLSSIKELYNNSETSTHPDAIAVLRVNKLNAPLHNYEEAVDIDSSNLLFRIKNYLNEVNFPKSGLSNCILTASQMYNPYRPIASSRTIVTNPKNNGFQQIPEEYSGIGNLVIASKPDMKDGKNNSYHAMIITDYADRDYDYDFNGKTYNIKKGEPLVSYSRGKNKSDDLRRNIPLSVYTDNSDGKTFNRFYTAATNTILLPEVVVTPESNYNNLDNLQSLYKIGGRVNKYSGKDTATQKMTNKASTKTLNLGETITPELMEAINGVYLYLTKNKGLSKKAAAAMMGNIWQESRFNVNAVNKKSQAAGLLLLLGNHKKMFDSYAANNKVHPQYGLLDYILYALNNPDTYDFYTIGYNKLKNLLKNAQKEWYRTLKAYKNNKEHKQVKAREKEYNNIALYVNTVYGLREKEGRLFPYTDLYKALYDEKYPLDSLTTLWHDTVERSNPKEANIENRVKAANEFFNYFNKGGFVNKYDGKTENTQQLQLINNAYPRLTSLLNDSILRNGHLPVINWGLGYIPTNRTNAIAPQPVNAPVRPTVVPTLRRNLLHTITRPVPGFIVNNYRI